MKQFLFALGFFFLMHNDLDTKLYYSIFWVDHTYGHPGAAHVAGGEIGTREKEALNEEYEHGTYIAVWQKRNEPDWYRAYKLTVPNRAAFVTLEPEYGVTIIETEEDKQ